jgi:hypothetical protein
MNNINDKILVKDERTLELKEDCPKGSIIQLDKLNNIDLNYITESLNESYNKKLEIELKKEKERVEKMALSEKEMAVSKVTNELNTLKNTSNKDIQIAIEKTKREFGEKINILERDKAALEFEKDAIIANLNNENKNIVENKNKDIENSVLLKTQELNEIKRKEIEALQEKYNDLQHKFDQLTFEKSNLNVKNLGESLETWCNNEVNSYLQVGGFPNCTWIKDNDAVKEEGDRKGNKGDFIFKIYASSEFNEVNELTSVMMDMKDEDPTAVNKQANEIYYKQLDKDRRLKNCQYSVLVSNLKSKQNNDLPVYKVNEYENMYVVRPEYLITFMNMLFNLHVRFSKELVDYNEHLISVKNQTDLMQEFADIKNTYLDKPLENLSKNIDALIKNNSAISELCIKNQATLDTIKNRYINDIVDKISRFDIKVTTAYKKFDKAEKN